MGKHLLFSQHLKSSPADGPIQRTFLGQAHIAGTGPEGKTCRECKFWHFLRRSYDQKSESWSEVETHRYFGAKHETKANKIKEERCRRPILNKAKRAIPHNALACRLFEPSKSPPPASLESVKGEAA